VSRHFSDCLNHAVRWAPPNRGLTQIEIQRWEDDGGAILPDAPRQHRHEPHLGHEIEELAAAE
jgi:hypothetical protein